MINPIRSPLNNINFKQPQKMMFLQGNFFNAIFKDRRIICHR